MYASSEEAEAAFYAAFSRGDLQGMMRVWSPDSDIVCIHPGGPRLCGVSEVRQSWEAIFAGDGRRSFTLSDRIIAGNGDQRIHMLAEHIRIPGTNLVAPPVFATNVYQRIRHGWYMLLHHASVAPEGMRIGAPVEDEREVPSQLH